MTLDDIIRGLMEGFVLLALWCAIYVLFLIVDSGGVV